MAHEIYIKNERASMAYAAGVVPWHKLGKAMDTHAGLDQWAAACGFEWEIIKTPVEYVDNLGNRMSMQDRSVLFRSDTGEAISVMSGRYQVVQPMQILDFFREVCESQRWSMETAGVLKGGAQYWALAKAGLNAFVDGRDQHEMYMLLATSADGSLATLAQATDIRVVCANTLGFALHNAKGQSVKVRHNTAFDAKQVQKDLGMVDFSQSWECFISTMESLQQVEISRQEATQFFSELLRPNKDATAAGDLHAETFNDLLKGRPAPSFHPIKVEDKERAIRGLAELETSYYTAPGACPGTAYGLIQGVTHYLDHTRGKDTDQRLSSAWFGQGAYLKQQAVDKALALV